MIEVNTITIDNKEYIIIGALENNNNKYLFLANENDEMDKCIRKIIVEDNKEYLTELDSDEEFEEIMDLFHDKYSNMKEGYDE